MMSLRAGRKVVERLVLPRPILRFADPLSKGVYQANVSARHMKIAMSTVLLYNHIFYQMLMLNI